jgi:hypothetical protein
VADTARQMNRRGNPETLVASQPGNVNAARHGAHSPRLIEARAAEIASELAQSFAFSPTQRLAVHEAARCAAILEAIDRDLDARGLVDKAGKARYLLNHRWRVSRQLDHWLEKISAAIQRQQAGEQQPRAEFADYVRELQRIVLGQDTSGSARAAGCAQRAAEAREAGCRVASHGFPRPPASGAHSDLGSFRLPHIPRH